MTLLFQQISDLFSRFFARWESIQEEAGGKLLSFRFFQNMDEKWYLVSPNLHKLLKSMAGSNCERGRKQKPLFQSSSSSWFVTRLLSSLSSGFLQLDTNCTVVYIQSTRSTIPLRFFTSPFQQPHVSFPSLQCFSLHALAMQCYRARGGDLTISLRFEIDGMIILCYLPS